MNDKVRLLETSGSLYTYYYTLGDTVDYYYSNLLPSTGYLKLFDIVKYYDGPVSYTHLFSFNGIRSDLAAHFAYNRL